MECDGASLRVFRALFGAVMLIAVVRFFAHGWIDAYFHEPTHFFTYAGFEWVEPWPRPWMHVHFAVMGVAALGNPIGAALGLADTLTDLATKWALEVVSPSAFVTQNLVEIEPTGLVGTIRWTITGRVDLDEKKGPFTREVRKASVYQDGLIEIVSQSKDSVTAYGSETCSHSYSSGRAVEQVDVLAAKLP